MHLIGTVARGVILQHYFMCCDITLFFPWPNITHLVLMSWPLREIYFHLLYYKLFSVVFMSQICDILSTDCAKLSGWVLINIYTPAKVLNCKCCLIILTFNKMCILEMLMVLIALTYGQGTYSVLTIEV